MAPARPLPSEIGPPADPDGEAASLADRPPERVVLVGNPNVGKSALFGALTGKYVTVSNYPGTTVEVSRGWATFDGRRMEVVDTPGAASFLPSSEDERVTRDILLDPKPAVVIAVGDAKNLERTLCLAVQLCEMRVAFVLALNMSDEAGARGIRVDAAGLSSELGVPVTATVAIRREGIAELVSSISRARAGTFAVEYPAAVEAAAAAVEPRLPASPISPRALALLAACGDATLAAWLTERMDSRSLAAVEEERQRLGREIPESVPYAVSQARLRAAGAIARRVRRVSTEPARASGRISRALERATTHSVWGWPILAAILAAAYLFVGRFGAKTLVDLLEQGLFGRIISPFAIRLADRWIPWALVRDLFVGPYGLVTMALAYSLALVFPIVGTFFLAFGLLEDSGYLPRLAVMVNRAFKKMGLNGKAVLPMVLGLGCDTMATLTTRILETPKERLIVILLLALGVPCSAQLTVVVAMLGGLSVAAIAIWAAIVLGVIVFVGRLAAKVLPGRGSDFVLELPPLRMPRPGNIVVKTVARLEWYLREAVPLFLLGTLILFVGDRLRVLGTVERIAEPVLSGALGLPRQTAEAFVLGFLRRDFGAAGLFDMARRGALSPAQILVSMVTITLFIPCIANFFMIVKERGWKTALAIAGFVIPFALAVGAALHFTLRLFPGVLG
jgi:ferrous iron transport protein B